MIPTETIADQKVTVMYCDATWRPCGKKAAKKIKIRYPTGKVAFAGVPNFGSEKF